jgi:L-aspartate oxidase
MTDKRREETEVLVLGCGIAGATAAYLAAKAGFQVTVATRTKDPKESNTHYAQGGIVALGENDSPELLAQDILAAGDGLSNPEAANILAQEGPKLVQEFLIKEIGIEFSRTEGGELDITREAAHSRRRILHSADATGKAIEEKLIAALAQHPRIKLLPATTAVDLITRPHHSKNLLAIYGDTVCLGAYLLDQEKKTIKTYLAEKTILATGGIGRVYLHTTNPEGARGDGLSMAYRAGAKIINAEYVQFHPTAFYHKLAERFLISESVRGEGARLINLEGRPFMADYDPQMKDLAARDVVARAIHEEMLKTGGDFVLLDLATYAKGKFDIKKRFPTIYEKCKSFGVDITKEPIPVVPAAHYFCGGVKVDSWSRTDIRNLFAIGEVACTGLHGANRLASTSLLEGLVWGARSAQDLTTSLQKGVRQPKDDIVDWHDRGLVEEVDPALIVQDWLNLETIMWNYAGIVRTSKRLERASADLMYLKHRIEQFYRDTKLTDDLIGLRNGLQTAQIIVEAARRNRKSLGCHYRKD